MRYPQVSEASAQAEPWATFRRAPRGNTWRNALDRLTYYKQKVRGRGEIAKSQTCGIVGISQSVLMINTCGSAGLQH
eukprot:COSAG01_NODE_8543_length_2748_cov_1.661382_5_plen_76_part_01